MLCHFIVCVYDKMDNSSHPLQNPLVQLFANVRLSQESLDPVQQAEKGEEAML
jgi:hypothetical protein